MLAATFPFTQSEFMHNVQIPMNPVEWLIYAAASEVWSYVGGHTLCEEFYASRAILQWVERKRVDSTSFPNWNPTA